MQDVKGEVLSHEYSWENPTYFLTCFENMNVPGMTLTPLSDFILKIEQRSDSIQVKCHWPNSHAFYRIAMLLSFPFPYIPGFLLFWISKALILHLLSTCAKTAEEKLDLMYSSLVQVILCAWLRSCSCVCFGACLFALKMVLGFEESWLIWKRPNWGTINSGFGMPAPHISLPSPCSMGPTPPPSRRLWAVRHQLVKRIFSRFTYRLSQAGRWFAYELVFVCFAPRRSLLRAPPYEMGGC